jgi:hypothetical protein
MSDTLTNLQQAAMLYGGLYYESGSGVSFLGTTSGAFVYQTTNSVPNGGHSVSYSQVASITGDWSAVSADFIGFDSHDIGYFHLNTVTCRVNLYPSRTYNVICSGTYQLSEPLYFNYLDLSYISGSCGDAGASTRCPSGPNNNAKIFNHSGSPVVAAVKIASAGGNNTWKAFAAGDASALTVVAAQAACGTASDDPCTGCCDDTAVTITGLT